jgi:hypothetical protein
MAYVFVDEQKDRWEFVDEPAPEPEPKPEPKPDGMFGKIGAAGSRTGELLAEGTKDVARSVYGGRQAIAESAPGPATMESLTPAERGIYGPIISEATTKKGSPLTVEEQEGLVHSMRDMRVQDYVAGLEKKKQDPSLKADPSKAPKGWLQDFVYMTPQMISMMGANVVGGPMAGLGAIGLQIAGGTRDRLIEQGVEPERASMAGVANAMLQAPMEQLGVGKIMKVWKPQKAILQKARDVAEAMGTEWFTEFAQAVGPETIVNAWAKDPDMEELKKLGTWLDAAKQGAYEGTLTSPWALLGLASPGARTQQDAAGQQETGAAGEPTITPAQAVERETTRAAFQERFEFVDEEKPAEPTITPAQEEPADTQVYQSKSAKESADVFKAEMSVNQSMAARQGLRDRLKREQEPLPKRPTAYEVPISEDRIALEANREKYRQTPHDRAIETRGAAVRRKGSEEERRSIERATAKVYGEDFVRSYYDRIVSGKPLKNAEVAEIAREVDRPIKVVRDDLRELRDQYREYIQQFEPAETTETEKASAEEAPQQNRPGRRFSREEGSVRIRVEDLVPRGPQEDMEKLERGRKFMDAAEAGTGEPRRPIAVFQRGDGKFKVLEGNTTAHLLIERKADFAQAEIKKTLKQQNAKTIDDVYAQAEDALKDHTELTKTWAKENGGTARFRPEEIGAFKSKKRAAEKVEKKYGSADKLKDVLASTVSFESEDQVRAALKNIENDHRVMDVRNRFDQPLPTGYRDVLMTVELSNGHLAEVQLTTEKMFDAKEIGPGHKIYEVQRAVEAIEQDADAPIAAVNTAKKLNAELTMLSKSFYDGVYDSDANSRALSREQTSDVRTISAAYSGFIKMRLPPSIRKTLEALSGEATLTKGTPSESKNVSVTDSVIGKSPPFKPKVATNPKEVKKKKHASKAY